MDGVRWEKIIICVCICLCMLLREKEEAAQVSHPEMITCEFSDCVTTAMEAMWRRSTLTADIRPCIFSTTDLPHCVPRTHTLQTRWCDCITQNMLCNNPNAKDFALQLLWPSPVWLHPPPPPHPLSFSQWAHCFSFLEMAWPPCAHTLSLSLSLYLMFHYINITVSIYGSKLHFMFAHKLCAIYMLNLFFHTDG